MSDSGTSAAYIESLARRLVAATEEVEQSRLHYKSRLEKLADTNKWLSEALSKTSVAQSISITLGGGESLVCIYVRENSYEFSVVNT